MQEVKASQHFYNAAELEFGKYHQFVVEFPSQTNIPNVLKTNVKKRRFQIMRITARSHFVINRLRNATEEIMFHIICGHPNIEIENRKTKSMHIQKLKERSSHTITAVNLEENKYTLTPPHNDSLVAVEILREETELKVLSEQTYEFCPNPKDVKRHQSFVRRTLSLKEIREKLIFMDAEFARTVDNKCIPVSVTIIDYNGKKLLDTICCPREKIRNYETKYHGLKERDVIGKEDSEDVIRKVQQLTKDRIIVGADLHMELQGLKINTYNLLGIRDLANALCIRRRMKYEEGQSMGLKRMAETILKMKVQEGFHSAREDAETVWKIYLQVEHEWLDHDGCSSGSPSEHEESFEEPMEIEDNFSLYAPDDEFPSIAIDSSDEEFSDALANLLISQEEMKLDEIRNKNFNQEDIGSEEIREEEIPNNNESKTELQEKIIYLEPGQIIKFKGRIVIENTPEGGVIRLLE